MNYPSYEDAKSIVIKEGIKSSRDYWSIYTELGLPRHPDRYYVGKGWDGWEAFWGEEKTEFPPYEEAKRIVVENGIKDGKEYRVRAKGLGLPYNPPIYYKNDGWTNWGDFCNKKGFPSYEKAKIIVIEECIRSEREYKARCKELGLPSSPNRTYKGKGWEGWPAFWGEEKKPFPSYEEAKRIVVENGISTREQYEAEYKKYGLPSSPRYSFKEEWVDWPTFLGKSHKVSHKERRTKVLSRLSLDPILLDDKAPLQVLYMVASCVDKDLAREIETLLDSTTPEDRLNWVKEQLKDVKEETTSRDGTISASPDEVSAMESMMDVFEDTFDDLSEEESTNIKTILENYYHNVINKELIAEYDD